MHRRSRARLVVVTLAGSAASLMFACSIGTVPPDAGSATPEGSAPEGSAPEGSTPRPAEGYRPAGSASARITAAAGGTVAVPDGPSVYIRPGALPSDTTITITELAPGRPQPAPPRVGIDGRPTAFAPFGLTFNSPVQITMPLDVTSVKGTTNVAVLRLDDETDATWEVVPDSWVTTQAKVAFRVTRFGVYLPVQLLASDTCSELCFKLLRSPSCSSIAENLRLGSACACAEATLLCTTAEFDALGACLSATGVCERLDACIRAQPCVRREDARDGGEDGGPDAAASDGGAADSGDAGRPP